MDAYKLTDGKLTALEREPFKLEIDIHRLVEPNLESLFQLEYVASEFAVGGFRLDTLSFDIEASSFVIVEYKKGHSYSVVDQGYSYLSVMLNNKADFVLEYNERKGKQLKRTDIDWTASRIIFVAPNFNAYQRNSVNFRDVPFELWEIKRFEGDIVVLERLESTSSESIEKVTAGTAQSVISTVSAEVKVVDEQEHVSRLDPKLRGLWLVLRERLGQLEGTSFAVSNGYISVKYDSAAVCYVLFRKSLIRIELARGNKKSTGELSKRFFTLDDPKQFARENSWTWKSGDTGHQYILSLTKEEEIDYAMYLIEQKLKALSS